MAQNLLNSQRMLVMRRTLFAVSHQKFPTHLAPALFVSLVVATTAGVWDYNSKEVGNATVLLLVAGGAMLPAIFVPRWWLLSALLISFSIPIAHLSMRNLALPSGHAPQVWETLLMLPLSMAGGFIGFLLRRDSRDSGSVAHLKKRKK